MRLLRLTDGTTFELDLHPFVTVVEGLDGATRPAVLRAVEALASGGDPGLAGLVEAHGVLLDLDASTAELLDLAGDVDPVVRAGDIPRSETAATRAVRLAADVLADARARQAEAARQAEEAAAVRAAAEEALDRERVAVAHRPVPTEGDLAAARQAVAEAERTRRELEAHLSAARAAHAEAWEARDREQVALDEIRERHRQATETCTRMARALERAMADRDPSAEAAAQAAAAWLADLRGEVPWGDGADGVDDRPAGEGDGPGASSGIPDVALRRHVERLGQRRAELLDRIGSPGGLAAAVRSALAALEEAGAGEPVREALALAEEWRDLTDRLLEFAGERPQDLEQVLTARQRLETARRELAAAEEAVRVPQLDRDRVEALEAAHERVLSAEDKAGGRFAGPWAERRVAAARAEEQQVLDELGFRTYADYMIGTSILHVDAPSEARLDAARDELAAAEDAWAALEATLEVELDQGALLDRARALRERAVELLGDDPGDDVEAALRRLRRAPEGGPAAVLRRLLEQVGVYVVDDAHLVTTAEAWLADQDGSDDWDREAAMTELAVIEAELAEVRRALDLPAEAVAPRRRDTRLDEAIAANAAAEQRLARHREAEALVAELAAALQKAAVGEHAIAAAITDAEERLAAVARPEQEAAALVARLEADLVRAVEDELAAVNAATDLEEAARAGADPSAAGATASLERSFLAAVAAEDAANATLARASAAVRVAEERLVEVTATADEGPSRRGNAVDEVEWFLLARLAAQRHVSFAGSLPLVVDDALATLPGPARSHLLDRLERMAATVQIVYLGDDAEIAFWAERAGPDRAAVVRPTPVARS